MFNNQYQNLEDTAGTVIHPDLPQSKSEIVSEEASHEPVPQSRRVVRRIEGRGYVCPPCYEAKEFGAWRRGGLRVYPGESKYCLLGE